MNCGMKAICIRALGLPLTSLWTLLVYEPLCASDNIIIHLQGLLWKCNLKNAYKAFSVLSDHSAIIP